MLYLGPFYYNYVGGVIIFAVIVSQYFLHSFLYNHGNIATDKPIDTTAQSRPLNCLYVYAISQ